MRIRINVNLPEDLVQRVDRICKIIHCPKANRSAAFEDGMERWCDRKEAELREQGKLDDATCPV